MAHSAPTTQYILNDTLALKTQAQLPSADQYLTSIIYHNGKFWSIHPAWQEISNIAIGTIT